MKHTVSSPTTDTSKVNFTVSSEYAGDPVSQTYDAAGYTTARTWSGGQAQAFKWDALGRLIELDQTVVAPFSFEAVYDGAGRRIRSEYTPSGGSTVVEECLFDPLVEFLELAVKTQGSWVWKIHGPDMGAGYGSLQGIGGIEAFIEEGSGGEALGAVMDLLGNVVATIDTSNTVSWSDTLISAYGPLPGTDVYHLDGTGATPVQALAAATTWRSMRIDPTDYICMGTRYYDPLAGRFMSPDPLGHAASMDLYSYANGDPINFVDPTGRKPGEAPNDGVVGTEFGVWDRFLYGTPEAKVEWESAKDISEANPDLPWAAAQTLASYGLTSESTRGEVGQLVDSMSDLGVKNALAALGVSPMWDNKPGGIISTGVNAKFYNRHVLGGTLYSGLNAQNAQNLKFFKAFSAGTGAILPEMMTGFGVGATYRGIVNIGKLAFMPAKYADDAVRYGDDGIRFLDNINAENIGALRNIYQENLGNIPTSFLHGRSIADGGALRSFSGADALSGHFYQASRVGDNINFSVQRFPMGNNSGSATTLFDGVIPSHQFPIPIQEGISLGDDLVPGHLLVPASSLK